MSIDEYVQKVARSMKPITDEQALEFARILLSDERMAA